MQNYIVIIWLLISTASRGTDVGHSAITSCTRALPPKKDAPGGPFNCIGLISGMIFAHSFLSSEIQQCALHTRSDFQCFFTHVSHIKMKAVQTNKTDMNIIRFHSLLLHFLHDNVCTISGFS